ncbi:extracellular solute-binding protein [Mesorhizobium sp.]|uniref:ABC transporter substrate-binding protein n=1 Tax=Mesorhizobium sp. TaxID=1871066 RepID=UPI00257ABA6D|nr:extracellular solute-binding protein [Mesorhizobium sp.]
MEKLKQSDRTGETPTSPPLSKEEMLRFLDFLDEFGSEAERSMELMAEPACFRMMSFLVRQHLDAKLVTITALAAAAGVPYATAMRRIEEMIETGHIIKRSKTKTGKSFSLHPSERMLNGWYDYTRRIKSIIGKALGISGARSNFDDYFFGGSYLSARIIPPPSVPAVGLQLPSPLRMLVHADPSFMAMESLKRQLEQIFGVQIRNRALSIDRLYIEATENAQLKASRYDLIACDLPWVGEFSTKNVLLNLDALIANSSLNVSDFHAAGWNGGRFNGKQYGIPIQTTPELLLFRRDLFLEDGLTPPTTTDELVAAARHFHKPHIGLRGIAWNGARGTPMGHTFAMAMAAFGRPILNLRPMHGDFDTSFIAGERLRPVVDSEEGRLAAEHLLELLACAPLGILNMSWYERMVAYGRGEVAMAFGYTLFAPYLEMQASSPARHSTGFLPHPRGPRGKNIAPVGGYLLGIPANLAPERIPAAWEAVQMLTSAEAVKLYILNGSRVSPRFSVSADPEVQATSEVITAVDGMARLGQLQFWPRPPAPEIQEIFTICGNEMHDMARGLKPARQALTDTQNQIDALMRAKGHY